MEHKRTLMDYPLVHAAYRQVRGLALLAAGLLALPAAAWAADAHKAVQLANPLDGGAATPHQWWY